MRAEAEGAEPLFSPQDVGEEASEGFSAAQVQGRCHLGWLAAGGGEVAV